jgi:hypothetical protein
MKKLLKQFADGYWVDARFLDSFGVHVRAAVPNHASVRVNLNVIIGAITKTAEGSLDNGDAV